MSALLADVVLVVHFAFVLFVVGGLALIWIGAAAGWAWVRNFWFRVSHLAAIAFVAGEALLGIWCPLTLWEARLRGTGADKSFIAEWIHRVLYYDLPEWMFTIAYVLFAVVVAATWWWTTRGPWRPVCSITDARPRSDGSNQDSRFTRLAAGGIEEEIHRAFG